MHITESPEGIELSDAVMYPTYRNSDCGYGTVLASYTA
jgi:hypothetical protein